jgi:hypothetical protein
MSYKLSNFAILIFRQRAAKKTTSSKMNSNLEFKLQTLSLLEYDWDGDSGLPVDPRILGCIKSILPKLTYFSEPCFCPVPNGSVDILWNDECVECNLTMTSLSLHVTKPPYEHVYYNLPCNWEISFVTNELIDWLKCTKRGPITPNSKK